MRGLAPILIAALLLGACATPPGGGGSETETETVDTTLIPPSLPERASVDLDADAVELPLEGLASEHRERLSSGSLTLEGIYTPPQGEPFSAAARYANGSASVSLEGLSPGEEYSLALRLLSSEDVGPWSEALILSLPPWEGKLSLSVVDVLGSFPLSEEPLAVVDPTPQFVLETDGAPASADVTWRIILAEAEGGAGESSTTATSRARGSAAASGSAPIPEGSAEFAPTEPLPEGRLTIEVGLSFPNGLLLPVARSFELRLGEAEPPRATAHGFGRSVVERPALRWAHQPGVSGYEVAFQAATGDGSGEQLAEAPTERLSRTFLSVGPGLLNPGTEYQWRVRPFVDDAEGAWSPVYTFVYQPIPLPFVPVIETGERVSYTQGYAEGSGDENPPREVELTIPFSIATTEMTNSVAAALINSGLAHRRFRVNGLVVETTEEAVPLLYLDTLEYGEQLGLSLQAEAERVIAVTGRANHPAVGLTWHGATALAEELSFVDGGTAPGEQWLYRLPTEAEWEYAATGGTGRIYPWGAATPRGRANYYRSGDPYEDVNPPYTRNGGPTTPVGFLTAVSPFGARDLLGNVWEWCVDWYDPEAYGDGAAVDDAAVDDAAVDPRGPESPEPDEFGVAHRSLRGLAWNSRVEDLRVQNRGKYPPESSSWSIGVRLVRSPVDLP